MICFVWTLSSASGKPAAENFALIGARSFTLKPTWFTVEPSEPPVGGVRDLPSTTMAPGKLMSSSEPVAVTRPPSISTKIFLRGSGSFTNMWK